MDIAPGQLLADSQDRADVLLLTGMHEELQWAQRTIGVEFTRRVRQGTSYLRGEVTIGDRSASLVTLRQLEKGLTTAAVTATKAICLWQPSVVVMTGICAGIRGAVELGDLIVATQCFEHSTGQRIEGDIVPAQNRVPIKPWLLDFLMAMTDSNELNARIQGTFSKPLPQECRTRIHYGSMACGPYVVKDAAYMERLKTREYTLMGLDMESYGVALAAEMCSAHDRQVTALIIKGVCDFADSKKADDWHDYCAYASASLAMAVLKEVMQRDHAYSRLKVGSPG
ncbi:MAG: hypothetical protein VKK62_02970 [Synechococcaceae cyanobacterium]|nr:hypothetical protein [Synechococcaceae cyanobacterium]